MLNSIADYTYNATNITTDGVDIQGRIMPTEDIDGEGHPLRRENFAYMCEGISERMGVAWWNVPQRNGGLDLPTLKTIWLYIKSFYPPNPIPSYYGSGGLYVKLNYTFGDVVSTTDDYVKTAYANAMLT